MGGNPKNFKVTREDDLWLKNHDISRYYRSDQPLEIHRSASSNAKDPVCYRCDIVGKFCDGMCFDNSVL